MGHGPFATSTLQPAAQSFYPGVEAWPQWPAGRVCPGCAGLAPWWPASSPFRCWLLQGSHLNLKALHILPATSPFILGVSLGRGGTLFQGRRSGNSPPRPAAPSNRIINVAGPGHGRGASAELFPVSGRRLCRGRALPDSHPEPVKTGRRCHRGGSRRAGAPRRAQQTAGGGRETGPGREPGSCWSTWQGWGLSGLTLQGSG